MNAKNLLYAIPLAIMASGCAPKTSVYVEPSSTPQPVANPRPPRMEGGKVTQQSQTAIPKATAFKMNGDYADKVAITLAPDGRIIYYPDPSDISANSAPLKLEGDWWLNRQGIGSNSVFTSYTFDEYSRLPKVPSRDELLKAVIPDAKVTEMVKLPVSISDASQNIKEINLFLKNL